MEDKKRGQAGAFTAFLVFLGSLIFVSAALTNSTNETISEIILNTSLPLNDSTIDNAQLGNQTTANITLANETINQTIPAENLTQINQSENLTLPIDNTTLVNITLPEKSKKNLTEIVEKHKGKLNDETKEYLKNLKDKKEQKGFIIKFKNNIDNNKLSNVTLDGKTERFNLVKIDGKIEDIENLIEDSEIEYLELEQDVEIFDEQIPFNIKKIKADSAWNLSNGTGVKVAVLDTGIGEHDDLSIAGGVSFVDNNYWDSHGHGTKVAGVIAALLNNEGIVGIAPSVSLYSVKIMQSSFGDLSDAISGIEWAIDNNMDIVSMSFGFDSYSQIFKDVLQEAYDNGILLVAASGNEGTDNILYPAKYDSVIAVGATTQDDELAYFSSYGFEQELVAPGVDINTTTLGNSYGLADGTSMSAPHVTGIAALIKSFNQSLTNIEIRNKLRNDALDLGEEGKDEHFGYGLVQINLDVFNFTQINETYFYEIFNITDFRMPNESYWFWVNGTGTIDDVDFEVGYYLVNKTFQDGRKKSDIYNVSKNGSITILTIFMSHSDDYASEGTNSDGITWVNRNYYVQLESPPLSVEGECFDADADEIPMDHCFFESTQDKNDCDADFSEISCSSGSSCNSSSTIGGIHNLPVTTSPHTFVVTNKFYHNCGSAPERDSAGNTLTGYVIDTKRINCINSSHYWIQGHYGNNNWVNIEQFNCGAGYICINNATNFTNPLSNVHNEACLQENLCTGTIQAIAEDRNGNPLTNLLVSRDLVSNKTTNIVGIAEYNLTKTCNQNMEFKVYCTNSSTATLCGTQTAKLDIINDYEGLLFDCSICSSSPDLQIDVDNVRVNKGSSNVTVNISLSGSFTATNINATFKVQSKDGLISRERSQLFNINSGTSFKFLNQTIALTENDEFLHVYIDTNTGVSESNEKNNYALVPLFKPQISAYFSISTGYTSIDNEIKDFLKLYVTEEPTQSKANVTIAVGLPKKNSIIESKNWLTQKNYQWFFTNSVYYNNKPLGSKPYNGIVGGFKDDYNYIFVGGNDIDGLLAAVKRLVSARSLFFNNLDKHKVKIIEDTDIAGISVADLLRNPSNKPYYNQRGSDAFAKVVSRILNNNNFEIAIKTVQTLNITSYSQSTILRLKNVNSDFSQNYKDVVVNGSKPVIMSGGIFSTLTTWEDNGKGLARDLVNDGHDVWEIEMNGGDNTECSTCPDYTYQDQVDYFWPALVAGVMNYSNKNKVNYIGHSNGCRVALSSLNSYSNGKNGTGFGFNTQTGLYDINISLPRLSIDKFFGVACPITLSGNSYSKEKITELRNGLPVGAIAITKLNASTDKHITQRDLAKTLNGLGSTFRVFFDNENKISINLQDFYVKKYIENNSTSPFNFNLSNSYLYAGDEITLFHINTDNDDAVPVSDIYILNSSINAKNAQILHETHASILNSNNLKNDIARRLK